MVSRINSNMLEGTEYTNWQNTYTAVQAYSGTWQYAVLVTGNQNISGVKDFSSRPTVAGTGVLLSGESASSQPNDSNLIIGLSIFI
jgi:hypothetical protein